FTLFSVACIGCCSLAPVMMVDDDTHGSLTPVTTRRIVRKVRRKTLAGEKKAAAEKPEGDAAVSPAKE
ncbi:MAG: hypothetical protein DRJ65_18985, partial [Acidobacteria bacterium]